MSNPQFDEVFAGSIPRLYEEYLVPLIFEQYAEGLAQRLASRKLTRVLEVAAGTGVVTRHLASLLPDDVSIVATDLNQPMLDLASEGERHVLSRGGRLMACNCPSRTNRLTQWYVNLV